MGVPDEGIEDGVLRYDLRHEARTGMPAGHTVEVEAAYAARSWIVSTPADARLAAVVIDFTDPFVPLITVTGYGPDPEAGS
jgi:hypothetical protein